MQLEAKNLSFSYKQTIPGRANAGKSAEWHLPSICGANGDRCVKKRALIDGLSFKIQTGERVGLIGPSGCGKSTLAKILAGYLAPSSGEVLLDGEPLPKKGYCPVQLIHQHPELAVNPRLSMAKTLRESWVPDEEILNLMGIEDEWMKRRPVELSGGELQRFCIARALGPQTKFLLCDEISTMLDVITQAQIWHLIQNVAEKNNLGLIVITHNSALAERVCDRVISLQ